MKPPRVALFYDWLNQWGGAEKVLLDLLRVFPNAPVYTLVHDPDKTTWLPTGTKVISSGLNNLPLARNNFPLYTPFYGPFLEQFDFSQYDIVISTTSTIGHCLITSPQTLFVCYFHNINRYIYENPLAAKLFSPIYDLYKKVDFVYSRRPDFLLCNSVNVQKKIMAAYSRCSDFIHPGIDMKKFTPGQTQGDKNYFLIVSRLVPHKKIDLAIRACHEADVKLIIVGTGRDKNRLLKLKQKLGQNDVRFLGAVSETQLLNLYRNCRALICPQEEDFGLTPVEAQACGKPVIAYNRGGITETVLPRKTGILFDKQTVSSLRAAIDEFNKTSFNPHDCIENAHKYSSRLFMLNFKHRINQLWSAYQKKITTS